jgi:4'-phosphopantetheinyl transferase
VRELPPPGSVDLVVIHDVLPCASTVVVTDEEERAAARHATEELALRQRGARGLMRLVASKYLGCRPIDVPIKPAPCIYCGEPHGKPLIDGSSAHINLSHAGNTVLIGISSLPVGVDVESETRKTESLALSRRFYSPAEAEWVSETGPAEARRRFVRLWVRKEALLKATGEGLLGGLDTVAVLGSTPLTVTRAVGGGPSRWTVVDVDAAAHPAAAVALAGDACELRVLSLGDLDPGPPA